MHDHAVVSEVPSRRRRRGLGQGRVVHDDIYNSMIKSMRDGECDSLSSEA